VQVTRAGGTPHRGQWQDVAEPPTHYRLQRIGCPRSSGARWLVMRARYRRTEPPAVRTVRGQEAEMTPEQALTYCLSLPGAWQDEPWEGDVVAKVGSKIFAFLGDESVGVKCGRSREVADEWLARYPHEAAIMPYLGRYGWNTLRLSGAIPDDELRDAMDLSYATVVAALPRRERPSS
jgi:predicted DNA-binding protein (MmcQ/YjbR family)